MNPKDRIGIKNVPLSLWPESATIQGAMGLLPGKLLYGRNNWREDGVLASVYYDATRRHLAAWFEGEDNDPKDGIPHLGHALANIAILVDSIATETFNDDRNYRGDGYRPLMDAMLLEVERLQELYANKPPARHYTIKDNKDAS